LAKVGETAIQAKAMIVTPRSMSSNTKGHKEKKFFKQQGV
jgi:hypothetical protein